MKKQISVRLMVYLLIVAMPLWFGSCGKGKSDAVTPASSIVGNWKMASVKINPAIDLGFGKIDDFYAFLKATGSGACLDELIFTYNKDGTTSVNNPKSCQGSDVDELVDTNGKGKWKLDGNKLTLTDATGATQVYDVVLGADTIQMSQSMDVEDVDGKPVKTIVTMGFKRA